jgi:hypothetical protein
MNHALYPTSFLPRALAPADRQPADLPEQDARFVDETARLKRLRSLLALFSLYAAALLVVVSVSDGADIGCILGGIAGHVLYATRRIVSAWRDAAWLDDARTRFVMMRRLRAHAPAR